jgi:hypothetical protein
MKQSILFLSVFLTSAVYAEGRSFQEMKSQADAIQAQAKIADSSKSRGSDSIGVRIAERMTDPNGTASLLLKDIRSAAVQTNDALEHAEEIVQNRYLPIYQKHLDDSKNKLDQKLGELNGRKPASISHEEIRDQVKAAYAKYQSLKTMGAKAALQKDPELSQAMNREVNDLRNQKLKDLEMLSQLGDQVNAAVDQAGRTLCRLEDNANCKNEDQLKEETARYQAISSFKKARAEATYETSGPKSSGAGIGQ